MDVIVPSHNIKILSSAVSTLGKIGKILYIEFDPLDGLTFRALNDAKSSFCCFHFDVGFFERCTIATPSVMTTSSISNLNRNNRNRNGSTFSNNNNNSKSRRRRKRGRSTTSQVSARNTNSDANDNDLNDNDDKYLCKVPIKTISAVLRSRKGVTSLRIRSTTSVQMPSFDANEIQNVEHEGSEALLGAQMQLSFEYSIQTNGILRVVHKVNVSNAEGIIAIANKSSCSEIVTLPKILLTMFDQVKSSSEVALIVHNDECKKVVASSFHYGDTTKHNNGNSNGQNNNMVINASNAAILKTETSVDCHEFESFYFMDEVAIQDVLNKENEGSASSNLTPPPDNVSEEITLVFSIKEAKAMLQFCVSSQSNYVDGEDARVIVSFYWGGRPLIIETEGEAFHGELILATVDHFLLNGS